MQKSKTTKQKKLLQFNPLITYSAWKDSKTTWGRTINLKLINTTHVNRVWQTATSLGLLDGYQFRRLESEIVDMVTNSAFAQYKDALVNCEKLLKIDL